MLPQGAGVNLYSSLCSLGPRARTQPRPAVCATRFISGAHVFEKWRKNKQRYLRLFNDSNQDRVRKDLATFFGLRSDHYLQVYEKMRANKDSGGFAGSWSWAAFIGAFAWFFYRKMYLAGSIIIILPIVFITLFPSSSSAGNFGVWIGLTMTAKSLYVHTGLGRLLKADELGLSGRERAEYLEKAGGVSLVAGIATGILYAAAVGLVIWTAFVDPAALK
jgi:hypothetical protein